MKKVFQSTDYYTAQLLKAYLHDNGIEATVSGELLMGAIGEIPANSYPTLWVVDDEDAERAQRLIAEYEARIHTSRSTGKNWQCPQCGEQLEAQFAQCWNCGASKP